MRCFAGWLLTGTRAATGDRPYGDDDGRSNRSGRLTWFWVTCVRGLLLRRFRRRGIVLQLLAGQVGRRRAKGRRA